MRVAIIQHVAFEGPGRIADWIDARGFSSQTFHPYAGDALPELAALDLLVVMGGPMSVHDVAEHPWLVAEKHLIRAALEGGKRVLGVCLGGQLIAEALGAGVRPGEQAEIGWWPLEKQAQAKRSPLGRMLPQRLMAMHWHGETFDLPAESIALYGSAACANQGFVWRERAVALQCHLESTPDSIEALLAACPDDLKRAGAVQDAQTIRDGLSQCSSMAPTLQRLLDYLSGPLASLT
ncbi:type 1 glutamine amidotransferase [Pseudomonas sp. LRF_L74]|uniref:type 1 glutamine amidotransferase n=1 Tax=Pseudomonas sp. LRF_L74 TaxID=3369422 RepID=UPI003F61111F